MSELTLFQGGMPTYLKKLDLDEDTKALMGGGGGARTHRISIKGRVFRMMVNGEELAVNEDNKMNVVVVRAAHKPSRTFYANAYREGEKIAPTCWSNDGESPDASIEEPQARRCADCPQNIAGSGQGESRACRYSWRLAVVLADDLEGEVYQLVLPATSVFGKGEQNKWPFKQYGEFLGSNNIPLGAVVTEMKFDPKATGPKLLFRPVRALDEEDYNMIRAKGTEPAAVKAIKMTVAQTDGVKKIAAPKAEVSEGEESEPVKRPNKKAEAVEAASSKKDMKDVLAKWGEDDEE